MQFADPESASSRSLRAALAGAVPPLEQRIATAVTLSHTTADSAVMKITHEAARGEDAQRVVNAITTAFLTDRIATSSTLVEAATLPASPSRNRAAPAIPLGTALGLLLGFLAAGCLARSSW